MQLKDIVTSCLEYKDAQYDQKYYWVLNGLTYQIDKVETYCSSQSFCDGYETYYSPAKDSFTNILHLSKYEKFVNEDDKKIDLRDNYIKVNLDNEITIFDNFIIVHKTNSSTDYDCRLFYQHNYRIDENTLCHTEYYVLGLRRKDGDRSYMAGNLRTVFKHLIDPPVPPKPADLTLDERVDLLIDELMKDSRTNAIKKLKRMLNDRL